jgi:hypothetical protein
MEKIEFYKNRTLSERFSASVDFLKQNWKMLYKNVLIGAIPLAIIVGYFMQYYQQSMLDNLYTGGMTVNPLVMIVYFISSVALVIYLNAMTGAVLKKYGERNPDSPIGWNDLYRDMLSLSGKTFLIYLIIWLIFIVIIAFVSIIIGIFISGLTAGNEWGFIGVITALVMFIFIGFLFAFAPFWALAQYPAYFSGAGIWKSIQIAFGMGFRNWGSIIVTLLLSTIVFGVIIMIFMIPYMVVSVLPSFGGLDILKFIFNFLYMLGTVLTYPVFFVFIAFQYFSIVESEQGVSLQSKVSEFENL